MMIVKLKTVLPDSYEFELSVDFVLFLYIYFEV